MIPQRGEVVKTVIEVGGALVGVPGNVRDVGLFSSADRGGRGPGGIRVKIGECLSFRTRSSGFAGWPATEVAAYGLPSPPAWARAAHCKSAKADFAVTGRGFNRRLSPSRSRGRIGHTPGKANMALRHPSRWISLTFALVSTRLVAGKGKCLSEGSCWHGCQAVPDLSGSARAKTSLPVAGRRNRGGTRRSGDGAARADVRG